MPQTTQECSACRRTKPTQACETCQAAACKDCIRFLDEGTFTFLEKLPDSLSRSRYCPNCFDQHVAPVLESYSTTMEAAKQAYIFFTSQRHPLPVLRKSKEKVHVKDCLDRDETILRLAFLAAERGFNAVIETEVTSEKVRNEGWQKSAWKGSGIPAEVDIDRLERRDGSAHRAG